MATITTQQTNVIDRIPQLVTTLRNHFNLGMTRPVTFRQRQLAGLARFLRECESEIIAALRDDLGKPVAETLSSEIAVVMIELKQAQKKLSAWMKPKKVTTSLLAQPGRSWIYPEPLGVVLIIAPWNYPLNSTLLPLIGALAAGNCVVLKPSEAAPAASRLLASKLPHYIDHECLTVVEGGVPETTALIAEHFDHVFYTGSGRVGKIVMTAAAQNLTPVTLELGGKSPCIVDRTANLEVAARRIVWGKFSNAGQTCVAPDYVLADAAIEEELLEKMRSTIKEFYGEHPENSTDYGRVINKTHFQRLSALLDSGELYTGGKANEKDFYIAPTILRNVSADSNIMAEEIFGPILPVLTIQNLDEAIAFINSRPKPLALYLFSESETARRSVIGKTTSGSICVNYTMLQMAVPDLPFGGVGASGMGVYHGKSSFDTFTHFKSVLVKPAWFDLSILYPPYGERFMKLVRWFM